MLPPALARRAYNDLPPILLNLMVSGAGGATAAAFYGIARKIASLPLIVRQSFLYVLSPLASAQASVDRNAMLPMYRFSTHISLLLAARADEAVIGPATPIVEMVGHKALPLVNSIIGLSIWLMLALWLVPNYGAVGMAMSVSAAVLVTAWAAVAELRFGDRLIPFGRGFWRAGAASLCVLIMLWLAGVVLAGFGAPIRAAGLFVLFWPSLWLGLRYGLDEDDKAALGNFGKRLRL